MTYRLFQIHISIIVLMYFWSASGAKRIDLWFAETLPLLIGYFLLLRSFKTFPLTRLTYFVILIGATLMLIGAYYSYSNVPLFEYFKVVFDFERNHFDRLVHFYQGVTITLISREIIIRRTTLDSVSWSNFFATTCAFAFAALWEVIEWLFVLIVKLQGVTEPAYGFLGEQNDAWDAQSDMFFAFIGSAITILIFSRYHDKKIKALPSEPAELGHD